MREPDELRRLAESRVREVDDSPDGDVEAAALVHELRVHQIELEMQNDELRRANTAADSARAEYEELYEDAPIGYLSLDVNAVITRANRTFALMLGVEPDRIVGRRLADFLVPDGREPFLRRFGALFRDPVGKQFDLRLMGAGGEERVGRLSANRSLAPNGGTAGGTASATDTVRLALLDVTDTHRAQRQIHDLLGQKELLFRELRHRTSNNYQLVLGMLSLQADAAGSPDAVEALARARQRVEAMMLVQESLAENTAETRAEIGTYLDRLVRRIVGALAPDGAVELVIACDTGYTRNDTASTIGLIVNELATNAWKHAFAGRGAGTLEVRLTREDGGRVLTVDDDGGGTTAPDRGTARRGLGQTLIEALTKQLGGTFECITSAQGTRGLLHLPRSVIEPGAGEPGHSAGARVPD